jgi:cellulose synthase/poly-beta-1,6-N-acetylglucosamine synthase-like glycosyltransferase
MIPLPELSIWIFLNMFWFYGLFNLGVFLVSHSVKSKPKLLTLKSNPHKPKVAVLYCCYNDFNEEALQSLLNLNYEEKQIFILDDSTKISVRDTVDYTADRYGVEVVRRYKRKGWKAGAINNILEKIEDHDYVVLSDSDEILPRDFIQRTLAYFNAPEVAFVQANHECYNKKNEWTKLLGVGVDLHWKHYQEYRNDYGLVQILGHGVIIKAEVLKRFKFPEMVSEDIALTFILAQHGFRGVFAKDVVCKETFPVSYSAFRRRHSKWCQGSAELIKRCLFSFICSKNVRWFEKFDATLTTMNLPLVSLFPVFIALSAFIKPTCYSNPLVLGMSILTMISPMLMFHDLREGFWQDIKTVLVNTLAYGSLFGLSVLYIFKGFLKPSFLVTSDKSAIRTIDLTLVIDLFLGLMLNLVSFPNILGFLLFLSPILWLRYH